MNKTRNNKGHFINEHKVLGVASDLENHQKYHCGIHINSFGNPSKDGIIDRRTPYGFGTPPEDQQAIQGGIVFDRTEVTWNCTICNFTRNRY